MWSRALTFQRLLVYTLNDTVLYHKAVSSFVNFSTAGGEESKKVRIKIVKPELTTEDEGENGKNGEKESRKTEKRRRTPVNLVTPVFDDQRRKELQTVVGLHVGSTTIYWAKIQRCGSVIDWSRKELFQAAEISRKIQLPKLYEEMYSVVEHLPLGDVYVLEGNGHGQPNSLQSSPSASNTVILRAQILAMLVALLNNRDDSEAYSSDSQQDSSEEYVYDYFHKVYLLRPRLMSRLFHLLVGTERVSALALVDSILDGPKLSKFLISDVMTEPSEESPKEHLLSASGSARSPVFTPVTVPLLIKDSYRSLRAVEREGMCQALLIAMTFYDLIIFKDQKVLAPLQM